MHDPEVVLFEVRRPIPRLRRLRRTSKNEIRLPYVRLKGWEAYFPTLATVWHHEPGGADSGTVCKGMGSSEWSWHNVNWGWQHRKHLHLQVSPWQQMCRRIWTRCAECRQPFRRHQAVFSGGWNGGGPGWRKPESNVYHDKCSAMRSWRAKADERLTILDLVMDLAEPLNAQDVQTTARLRGDHNDENRAWRVFYDLDNKRKKELT